LYQAVYNGVGFEKLLVYVQYNLRILASVRTVAGQLEAYSGLSGYSALSG
jgi:hypothetical protein